MAKLRVHNIEPSTGTDVAFGTTGDTIAVSSDSLKLNTWKDSGGNTLFQSDGAGTLSSVNSTFSGAGPKLILSQAFTGSSTVSFTSDIDSTYDKYMFVLTNITSSTSREFFFNCSIDGGSNYNVIKTTTYFSAHHQEDDGDTGLDYRSAYDLAQSTAFQRLTPAIGAESDECAAGIFYLFSPSSTTYVKQFYSRFNTYRSTDETWDTAVAGYMNTTSAVDAIQFKCEDGTFDGKIKMYGVT